MRIATVERVKRIEHIWKLHDNDIGYNLGKITDLVRVFTTNDLSSICKVNEFNVGDKVIYIHKGALLPDSYNCQKYTRKGFVCNATISGNYSTGVIVDCPADILRYPIGCEVSYRIGIPLWRGKGPKYHQNIVKNFRKGYCEYIVNKSLFKYDTPEVILNRENWHLKNENRQLKKQNAALPESANDTHPESVNDTPSSDVATHIIELGTAETSLLVLWLLSPLFFLYNRM